MAKRLSGLGRGLDALFPSDFQKDDVINGARAVGVSEINITQIAPMKDQPRTVFDEEKISQLAQSIKEHGILQPLVLVEKGRDEYQIIAGERRFRAAKTAGLKTVPAVIRTATDLQQLEIALVENIQREDLSSIDQAISIRRLHEDFSQNYEQIAKKLGKAKTTVVNIVRLLSLTKEYQTALRDGVITEGHARSLLAINDEPAVQIVLFTHIVKENWSVRKAELFVKSHKESKGEAKVRTVKMQDTSKQTQRLEKKLSRTVRIQRTAKGGKLTISFSSDDDLESLLSIF